MQRNITIQLPPEIYQPLYEAAVREGRTVEEVAAEKLRQSISALRQPLDAAGARAAEERFNRWIGAFNSGNPHSADNEGIDADLARAYADTHDDE